MMSSRYEIEFSEPTASRCACCGGLTVRLTRFVERDGAAFAIYYAAYSNQHADHGLSMLVSLGNWGEGSVASERSSFYCRVRPTVDSYQVTLGDAADSAWGAADITGNKLSRDQARQHPWKATAFELLDEAFVQDRSLRGFVTRVQCGDPSIPLEMNFGAPDDIFALGGAEKGRAELGRSFASLDGERFFVRCLLPVPIEHYGPWCVGVWLEVAKSDYDQARNVWNDAVLYPRLRVTGVVANDMSTNLALRIAKGSKVAAHVSDPNSAPRIETPERGELAQLLTRTWSRAVFETYAIAHGFL